MLHKKRGAVDSRFEDESHKSFMLSCYSTARSTQRMTEDARYRVKVIDMLRDLGVQRIYLESYRGFLIPTHQLTAMKAFFDSEGFLTSGGVCIGFWGEGFGERNVDFGMTGDPSIHVCLTSESSKEGFQRVMQATAEVFDVVLIDDLYANFCHCDRCLKHFKEKYDFKGGRRDLALAIARNDPKVAGNWEDFSLELVRSVSREYVIGPAKNINPKVRVNLKVAEWYEKFNHRGVSLKGMVSIFDGLYVGTESREGTARYGSYFLSQYAREIARDKFRGSWFDTLNGYNYDIPISEQIYIEQARMSALGQSPEIILFGVSDLLEPRRAQHLSRLQSELPTLRHLSGAVSSAKSVALAVLKPHHSPHVTSHPETYIFDILGSIGIPLAPVTEIRPELKSILITAHGAHGLKVERLREKEVFLTSGAIDQLAKEGNREMLLMAGLNPAEPIVKDCVQARAVTVMGLGVTRSEPGFSAPASSPSPFPVLVDHRRPAAVPLGPALRISKALPLLVAHDEDGDYVVATQNNHDGTEVYCLSLTWFPWYLKLGYIEIVREVLRELVGETLGFKITAQGDGLGDVTIHAYDNGLVSIDNLANTYCTLELHVRPEQLGVSTDALRIVDFVGGEHLKSRVHQGWVVTTLNLSPAELKLLRFEED